MCTKGRITLKSYLKKEAIRLANRDGEPFNTALILAEAESTKTRCFYPLLLLKVCEGGGRAEKLLTKVRRADLREEGAVAIAALNGIEDIEALVLSDKSPKNLPREFSKQLESWRCIHDAPEVVRSTKTLIAARVAEVLKTGQITCTQLARECDIDPGNLSAFAHGDLNRLGRMSARCVIRQLAADGFLSEPLGTL